MKWQQQSEGNRALFNLRMKMSYLVQVKREIRYKNRGALIRFITVVSVSVYETSFTLENVEQQQSHPRSYLNFVHVHQSERVAIAPSRIILLIKQQ